MANYNAIGKISGLFSNTSALPFVGFVVNEEIPASTTSALNNSSAQLLPGDPIVLTINNNSGKNLDMNQGYNYNNTIITKKATTATSGANSTNVCGFLAMSSSDVSLAQGSVPVPQQGVLTKVARLGAGAQMWLEVASQNVSGFQTTLDTNVSITIDSTNGGVKVGSGTDILAGAKVISGLQNAQKIALENGVYVIKPCTAILVEFK